MPPFEGHTAEEISEAILDFKDSGKAAEEKLREAVLDAERSVCDAVGKQRTETISEHGAAFMRGLLTSNEAERIGSGTEGFSQFIRHPWLETIVWDAMLRREVAAPWVPPAQHAADELDFDLTECKWVRGVDEFGHILPVYDAELWDPMFQPFGQARTAPWPDEVDMKAKKNSKA